MRLGFVDRERTARERLALDPAKRGFGYLAVGHLDEPKALGVAGVAVGNDTDCVHHAIRLKERADVLICGGERQIANKAFHVEVPRREDTNDRQVIQTIYKHNTEEKQ